MAKENYYKILEVNRADSIDTIKKSYKKLALKYHPDKAADDKKKEFEEKFKAINEAYSVIGDETKRKGYDAGGSQFSGGQRTRGSNFSDIFSDIFSRGFGNQFSEEEPDQDLHYRMVVEFREAAFGCEKEIMIKKDVLCDKCEGAGSKDAKFDTCGECDGNGRLHITQQTPFGIIRGEVKCDECDGEGTIPKNKCSNCRGRGIIRGKGRTKVKIPKGIDNGQTLRIMGEGNAIKRGLKGDLYLQIQIQPDENFQREGVDVYTEFSISFSQAALGAKVQVPTLSEEVSIKVSKGIESGSILRIKGKGIPYLNSSNHKGDQFVKIIVKTPKKLSKAQIKLYKELEKLDD